MLSKVLKQTVKRVSHSRPLAKSMLQATAVRSMANASKLEKAVQKLGNAINREIQYENENYAPMEDTEQFLNESGFAFKENEGTNLMTLTKTVGDKTIEVEFTSRQPNSQDEYDQEGQDQMQE